MVLEEDTVAGLNQESMSPTPLLLFLCLITAVNCLTYTIKKYREEL